MARDTQNVIVAGRWAFTALALASVVGAVVTNAWYFHAANVLAIALVFGFMVAERIEIQGATA